jgi:rRNA pseudouridine-1189 N-methylase Emg1 (Nep1/Mra1 family)
MELVAKELANARNPVLLVGGFPVGHFSAQTSKLMMREFRIDRRRLEAVTVVGRAIYDYEKAINLPRF